LDKIAQPATYHLDPRIRDLRRMVKML
jgi:hypothetical protein